MSGEHFLVFVGVPFTAAVLGLLSWRIATSKGRSGWWALAGLGFHIGLIVVLALPVIRPPRPGKTREPDEPDTDAAPSTGGEAQDGPVDEAKRVPRPARGWKSGLARRPRVGWRSNDLLFLLELQLPLMMGMVLVIGFIVAAVGICGLLAGSPVRVNGRETYSIPVRLWTIAFPGALAVCGAVYLFHIRPGLIGSSERDAGRRPRRKHGVSPPPEE
ncbi:MAG: hypothetical protein ACYTKD_03285 [Planctomycetota bacterium]|jgi:hypothetical protein